MPGPNTTGKPDPRDYELGKGIVYYAVIDQTTGQPDAAGWRDLGNAPAFSLAPTEENLEHFLSRRGTKTKDRDVIISRQINGTFELDEWNDDNLALLLDGTMDSYVNPSVAGFVAVDIVDITQGRWYDIWAPVVVGPPLVPTRRAYDIGAATLLVGAVPMVEGVDYELDSIMGRIFIIEGGIVAVAGATVLNTLAANASAATPIYQVQALQETEPDIALKFISENPNNAGSSREYEFHRTKLRAQSDIPLIGDTWKTMSFAFSAESNELGYPDSPLLTITTHSNAFLP